MSETSVTSTTNDGKQSGEPVLTSDVKKMSDSRMSSMAASMLKNAPRVQKEFASDKGVPLPNSVVKNDGKSGDKSDGVVPAKETSQKEPEAKSKESSEKPNVEIDKSKETPKVEPREQKQSKVDWEFESKKHQSRADTFGTELEKVKAELLTKERQIVELSKAKDLVDKFEADPVSFINERLPDLGKKLANAGDPIKMIESEVGKFAELLETQFKKELGEDWRYSDIEAIRPGTPSFRYRLAIDSKISEVRAKQQEYVSQQRNGLVESQKKVEQDKQRIKQEFGFTDADLQEAEKILEKEGLSPYSILKLGLIDKIIQLKLDSLLQAPRPPKDISKSGSSADSTQKDSVKVSEGGMRVLGRIGVHRR